MLRENVSERVKECERKCLWAMQVKPAGYHTFSAMSTPQNPPKSLNTDR